MSIFRRAKADNKEFTTLFGKYIRLFPLVVLLPVFVVAFMLLRNASEIPYLYVYGENSVWDVRGIDFEHYNVRFGGEAGFIPELLTPAEFAAREGEAVLGSPRTEQFLTSRLTILVPDEGWFTFTRPSIDYSHRLYVNGEFMLEIGKPGAGRGVDVADTGRITFTAQSVDGVIEIVQQSSNFVHRQGGFHHNWTMGMGDALGNEARVADFQKSILMGSFLMLFLIMLLFYCMLRGNKGTLYGALFSLMWFLRMGTTDGRVFTALAPWLSWEIKFRIEYISLPVAGILVCAILNTLFPKVLPKLFMRIFVPVLGGFIALYLFADTVLMSRAILLSYAVLGFAILFALVRMIMKVRNVNMGQTVFIVGVVIFLLSAIPDVFYFTFDEASFSLPFQLTGVAMLLFMLCIATAVFIDTMQNMLSEIGKSHEKERETRLALEEREKLLHSVNQAALTLLAVEDESEIVSSLAHTMEMIGKCLNVDRIHLSRCNLEDGAVSFSLISNWYSELGKSNPILDLGKKLSLSTLREFEDRLMRGECFNGPVTNLPIEAQEFLNPYGTLKSIIIIPMFLSGTVWGFITVDDCEFERELSEKEMNILHTVSLMFTSVFGRFAQKELAITDALTGVRNRRYFEEISEWELENCIDKNCDFSVIMTDIDHFKSVNDRFGHIIGDDVLKIFTARMRHVLKQDTLLARYGGEEFVVALPGVSHENAIKTAWRLNKAVAASPFVVEGLELPVTASFGVASITAELRTIPEIMSCVDKALYNAKATGRNTVVGQG